MDSQVLNHRKDLEANVATSSEPEILSEVEVPVEENHDGVDGDTTADPSSTVKPPTDPVPLTGNTDPSETEKVNSDMTKTHWAIIS